MDNQQQYYGNPYVPNTPVNQQPVYYRPPSKSSLMKKVLILFVVFAVIATAVGIYLGQKSQVAKLQKQVSGLQAEVKDLKSQLESSKTATNSGGLFTGIQAKSRDTERNVDIKALHGQIEAYYAQNGRYPTLLNMNDASWVSVDMRGLDSEALSDPTGKTPQLAGLPTKNAYAYQPLASDDTACDNDTKDCAKYALTATLEQGGVFVKNNLN